MTANTYQYYLVPIVINSFHILIYSIFILNIYDLVQ